MKTSRYRALHNERAQLVKDASALVELAQSEGRALTATERSKVTTWKTQIADLGDQIREADIERAERLDALPELDADDYRRVNQPVPASVRNALAKAARGPLFAQMFGPHAAMDNGGFETGFEMYRALAHGDYSRFEMTSFGPSYSAANFDAPSGAGYLIPPEYTQVVFDQALSYEVVRPRARLFNMTGDQLSIAGVTHQDGSAGAVFGVTPAWTKPGEQATPQVPKVQALSLVAWKLMAFVAVPNEVMADAVNFEPQMNTILSEGLSWTFDKEFLTGDGVGKPLGALHASNAALVTVAKDSSQTAGTVTATNVSGMLARLPARSFPRACWVISPSVLQQLLTVSLIAGATEPLLESNRGEQGNNPELAAGSFSMLGLPVFVSEHLAAVGTIGDIALCDFSQYAIGLRKDYSVQTSPHIYFDYDMTGWRSIARATGLPLWTKPYTPSANGGTEMSPFIVLATRS